MRLSLLPSVLFGLFCFLAAKLTANAMSGLVQSATYNTLPRIPLYRW